MGLPRPPEDSRESGIGGGGITFGEFDDATGGCVSSFDRSSLESLLKKVFTRRILLPATC